MLDLRSTGAYSLYILTSYSNPKSSNVFPQADQALLPRWRPQPWKVVIILQELGLAYETEYPTPHAEPYTSVNPNGRVPAIEDPNTGITLWETGSIIEYLLDNYDKEGKLQYTSFPEKYEQSNWKHFQMSGQGPYFGQYMWFAFFHPEKIPSASDRYKAEIKRVWSVIHFHLNKTGKPYLVGDKVCFADLMFITWNNAALGALGEGFQTEIKEEMPRAWEWHQKLMERESVVKTFEEQAQAKKEAGVHY